MVSGQWFVVSLSRLVRLTQLWFTVHCFSNHYPLTTIHYKNG